MRRGQRAKLAAGAGLATMVLGALMVLAPSGAGAQEALPVVDKVTVCHRTNAVTNPYRIIEVAVDGSDGSLGNGMNDHTQHLGPPFDFSDPDQYEPPFNGDDWGDIIPPYQWGPNPEDYFPGYNWNGEQTLEQQCGGAPQDPTTLTLVKVVAGEAAPQTWSYDFTGLVDDVTLTDADATSETLVIDPDVTYEITESGTDGVVTADCTGATSDSLDGRTLSVAVAPGGDAVCTFTNTFDPPPTASLTVVKTNDANGDGTFSDDEEAATPGAATTFQLVITNTGEVELTLTSLTDTFGSTVEDLLSGGLECGDTDLVVGSTLAAGSTTTCTFVLEGYTPAAGGSLVNTVAVDTQQTEPATDTSTVRTAQVAPQVVTQTPVVQPTVAPTNQVLGAQVVRTLPRTGNGTRNLAGAGAVLVGLGMALTAASRRRSAAQP